MKEKTVWGRISDPSDRWESTTFPGYVRFNFDCDLRWVSVWGKVVATKDGHIFRKIIGDE